MSKDLNTHFERARTAQELPTREALLRDVLGQILSQCDENYTFKLPTGKKTKKAKAENADRALGFFIKWSLSTNKYTYTNGLDFFNYDKTAYDFMPPRIRWNLLKNNCSSSLSDTEVTCMYNLGNGIEIMAETAHSDPLETDGELLWQTLVSGIEAGRKITTHYKQSLNRPASDQLAMVGALKDISNLIDLFGGTFAGLDQKTITALKNEMLDPEPFDKVMLVHIRSIKPQLTDQQKLG
jgi:hypothetical protein